MRSLKTFIADVTKKPPLLFPLVALFHIVLLVYTIWAERNVPLFAIEWLQPLWMLAYTAFWLYVCDMRRWAAIGYLVTTSLNLALLLALKGEQRELITNALFPIDVLFSFFVLFFYKRFQ